MEGRIYRIEDRLWKVVRVTNDGLATLVAVSVEHPEKVKPTRYLYVERLRDFPQYRP